MNQDNYLYSIISKYLRGNCTGEEFDKVRAILKEPHSHLGLRGVLYEKWKELEAVDTALSEEEITDLRNTLSDIHHTINLTEGTWENRTGKARLWNILSRVAAILLLPVLTASLWYFYVSQKPYAADDAFVTITTPPGSRITTELPDGTVVWQNSGSTLRYPRNFTRRNRQVELQGEAFFDVATDKLHPFYVRSGELLVTVTGTRFNVSDYAEDSLTAIVLERGEISVARAHPGAKRVILMPGDRLESRPDKDMVLFHNTDVQKYVSWIDGRLIFRDDPLAEILRRLERWYNVAIEVNDPGNLFSDLPFTMTIRHETLPQILEYLRRAAPFSITEEKLALQADGSFSRPKYIVKYKKN